MTMPGSKVAMTTEGGRTRAARSKYFVQQLVARHCLATPPEAKSQSGGTPVDRSMHLARQLAARRRAARGLWDAGSSVLQARFKVLEEAYGRL